MSVRNVKIKNFKCFQEESIELSKLTVLTGRNSAGKSSFIQSLLLYELSGKEKRIYTNNVFGLNLGLPSKLINFTDSSIDIDSSGQEFQIGIDGKTSTFSIEEERFSENYLSTLTNERNEKTFYYINAERFGPRVSQMIEKTDVEDVGSFGQNTLFVLDRVNVKYRALKFNLHRRQFQPDRQIGRAHV